MSGSVQVTLLLPLAMLVLLAALQWSLLLWAESTAIATTEYYNTRRLQRKLGILTPFEKHEQYLAVA